MTLKALEDVKASPLVDHDLPLQAINPAIPVSFLNEISRGKDIRKDQLEGLVMAGGGAAYFQEAFLDQALIARINKVAGRILQNPDFHKALLKDSELILKDLKGSLVTSESFDHKIAKCRKAYTP